MSEKTKKTQDELLDAAAVDAAETYKVEVDTLDESDLDPDMFCEDVSDMLPAVDIPIQVLTFDNPTDSEKPLRFAVRQLTSEEHAQIFGGLFDAEIFESVLGDTSEDREASANEIVKELESDANFVQLHYGRQVRAAFVAMVLPKKKTIESVGALPRSIVKTLSTASTKRVNQTWSFR